MTLSTHCINNIKVLSIIGDLNSVTAGEAEIKLTQLIMGGNKKMVVNLDQLNYIPLRRISLRISILD